MTKTSTDALRYGIFEWPVKHKYELRFTAAAFRSEGEEFKPAKLLREVRSWAAAARIANRLNLEIKGH
jgi:hypothetical protein